MDLKDSLDQFTEEVKIEYVLAGLLIVVGIGLIAGADLASTPDSNKVSVNLSVDYGDSFDSQMVKVNNSSSAFHALNKTYDVEYQTSSYGIYITGINGVSSNGSYYWIYTVNGEAPEVGAGQYKLNGSEEVTFSFKSSEAAKNATS